MLAKYLFAMLILCLLPLSVFSATPNNRLVQTTTGSLVGMVIDLENAPIKGALVRVVNSTNGFAYGRRTSEDGIYRIDFLPAGVYDITASADGYQPNLLSQFLVEVNREKVIKPPPIKLLPDNVPAPV